MPAADEQRPAQSTPKPPAAPDRGLSRILMAVWMAILLGIGLQLLVLGGRTAAGAPFPGLKWLPDLLNGVTWAVFVCAGVVLGALASRARAAVMGLLGFISAPMAFSLAKGLQRGLQNMMDAPVDKITPAFYAVAGVKAVEYACLGASLGWLLSRGAMAWRFAALGLGAGVRRRQCLDHGDADPGQAAGADRRLGERAALSGGLRARHLPRGQSRAASDAACAGNGRGRARDEGSRRHAARLSAHPTLRRHCAARTAV